MAQKGLGVALGSLLACEVDVIATHATLRGSNWRSLKSKVTGEFNYGGYVVAAEEQDPATSRSSTWSASKATNASKEQIQDLVKLCETASPAGTRTRGQSR